MKNKLNLINIYLFIFPLFFYSCYFYLGLNPQIVKFIYYLIILISLFIFFKNFTFSTSGNYVRILKYIIFVICFSAFSAYFFWNQNLLLTYQSTSWCLGIIYFFNLLKFKPKIEFVEKVILIYGFLYIILWSIAFFSVPRVLFSASEEIFGFSERGIVRINLPGYTALVLSLFLSLNKYIETRDKKWGIYFILFAIFIVLQVIRQVIFFSFIIAFVYIFKKKIKIVLMGIIASLIFSIFFTFSKFNEESLIGSMVTLSQSQIDSNKKDEEDIRIQEYKFFLTDYTKNIFTTILGNGVANAKSEFGKFEEQLILNKYFYTSDVGYAELYIRFGIISIVLYFIIFFKVLKQKIFERYFYTKLFVLYLFLANIASAPINADSVLFAICLYILEYNFWMKKAQIKNKVPCSQ